MVSPVIVGRALVQILTSAISRTHKNNVTMLAYITHLIRRNAEGMHVNIVPLTEKVTASNNVNATRQIEKSIRSSLASIELPTPNTSTKYNAANVLLILKDTAESSGNTAQLIVTNIVS